MRQSLVCLAVLALVSACKRGGGQESEAAGGKPPELAEVEPNDSAQKAMPLTQSCVVKALLSVQPGKPDEDWYRLPQLPGQMARVELSGIPGADLAIELYDQDRNRITTFNSMGEGQGERIPNLSLDAPYLVRVLSMKKDSGGAYTLTLTIAPAAEGMEKEPNNRAVDATPLAMGGSVGGVIGDVADEDWYRIELSQGSATPVTPPVAQGAQAQPPAAPEAPNPTEAVPAAGSAPAPSPTPAALPPGSAEAAPGAAALATPAPTPVVRLEVSGVPGVRLDVSVATQAEAVLYNAKTLEGESLQVRNLALRPGENVYYVVVKSAWVNAKTRTYNPEVPYRITVTPEEGQGQTELEPNNDPQHATPLPLDGSLRGFLTPKGDVDYYVVKAERPSLMRVELSGLDRVDLVLSIVKPGATPDAKEELLLKADDGKVKEPEILPSVYLPGGETYVKVEGASRQLDGKWVKDYENPTEPYRLSVSVRPDDGTEEHEPNDKADWATPLALSKAIHGTIHPKKDLDLFRLDLSHMPVKTPLKATVTGILKVDVALLLYRMGPDGKPKLVQTSDRGKNDAPEVLHYSAEPGVYFFEVRDTKNRESNFQDSYQLTVETE